MPSLLELQDLYNEALTREILEKTKVCGLNWNHLGGTQFQATQVDGTVTPEVTWDFFVSKTQVGNITNKYTLNVKKDGISYIALNDGPLPASQRDSVVKELYETVEMIVLEMDVKLKETLNFVQNITGCRDQ